MAETTRVAVVGAGAAGLTAAMLLQKGRGRNQERFQVTLFERETRAGGHALTDGVHGPCEVDLGFQVYNLTTYPHLVEMFEMLGVDSEPSCMSFSVSRSKGCRTKPGTWGRDQNGDESPPEQPCLEWGSLGIKGLFADWKNLFSPGFYRMILDALRFKRDAEEVLTEAHASSPWAKETLGEFLHRKRYGKLFIDAYVAPMCAAVWSVPAAEALAMPAGHLIRFWKNHHLLDVIGERPVWRVVKDRSKTYVDAIIKELDDVQTGVEIVRVKRSEDKAKGNVCLLTADGQAHYFEHVILATHTDTSLRLLGEQLSPKESACNHEENTYAWIAYRILNSIAYQDNKVYLHGDRSLMPKLENAWASWNCLSDRTPASEDKREVCVTYWLNHLQLLPESNPELFCTLNPIHEPDPSKVYLKLSLAHPVFGEDGWDLQEQFLSLQRKAIAEAVSERDAGFAPRNGSNPATEDKGHCARLGSDGFNVWFCGAWCGYGFHEDAVRSAVAVVHALGGEVPWLQRLRERRLRSIYPSTEVAEIIKRQGSRLVGRKKSRWRRRKDGSQNDGGSFPNSLSFHEVEEEDIDCAVGCSPAKTWTQLWYQRLFEAFGATAVHYGGMRFILPTGEEITFGTNKTPECRPELPLWVAASFSKQCRVRILNWDFFKRIVQSADIGLGEAFVVEDFVVDDLPHFLNTMVLNAESATKALGRFGILSWVGQKLHFADHKANANTIEGSQANISAHYDLGNKMYMRFLDETMLYSSGIHYTRKHETDAADEVGAPGRAHVSPLNREVDWSVPSRNLKDAQIAKLDAIIDRLQLLPGELVLEVGCGWGGFAIRACSRTGCRIVGITLSTEQLEEAEKRVKLAGLANSICFRLCDYRQVGDLLKDDSIFAANAPLSGGFVVEPKSCPEEGLCQDDATAYRQGGVTALTNVSTGLPMGKSDTLLSDTRHVRLFDKIVSIEMIEAVGHENLSTYFSSLSSVLRPGGLAVIQAITIPDSRYSGYCKSSDFIKKYVFPGGHMPSLGAMLQAAYNVTPKMNSALRRAVCQSNCSTPADTLALLQQASPQHAHLCEVRLPTSPHFVLHSFEDIGPDYAETLRCWRENWTREKEDIVVGLGYGPGFHRLFEFYFAYCEAAFRLKHLHDYILVWRKPDHDTVLSNAGHGEGATPWYQCARTSLLIGTAVALPVALAVAKLSKASK